MTNSIPASLVFYGQALPPSLVVATFILERGEEISSQSVKKRNSTIPQDRFVHLTEFGTSLQSQALFLDRVIRPLQDSPPPREYSHSVLKLYIRVCENSNAAKRLRQRQQEEQEGEDEEEEEEEQEFHDDLLEAIGTYSTTTSSSSPWSFITIFEPFNSLPISLAVKSQFENVGLSLWPAASVLSNHLVHELAELKRSRRKFFQVEKEQEEEEEEAETEQLLIVELGAGVGITGALVETAASSLGGFIKRKVRFVMTDYQSEIVGNGRKNLADCRNRISATITGKKQEQQQEEEEKMQKVRLKKNNADDHHHHLASFELLDWTDDNNSSFFESLKKPSSSFSPTSFLICGADLIYDAHVVPGLAETISIGMRVFNSSSSDNNKNVKCNIIHTMRNENTFNLFADELKKRKLSVTVKPVESLFFTNHDSSSKQEEEEEKENQKGDFFLNRRMREAVEFVSSAEALKSSHQNLVRSLQDGKFFGSLFAKMSGQLRVLEINFISE